jgi:hypothetical protein
MSVLKQRGKFMVNTIGCFYETPFGTVFTYGIGIDYVSWYKIKRTKRFKNIYQHGHTKRIDTTEWIRKKIEDFPDSADPVLPYVFDLYYDIKTMSQLRAAFRFEDRGELLDLMRVHEITFKKNKKIS